MGFQQAELYTRGGIRSGGAQFKPGRTSRALRRVVLDGQAGPEHEAHDIGHVHFIPDSRHHFYEVTGAEPDKDLVVFDGLEGRLYGPVFRYSARFSDEQTIEFVARDGQRYLRVTETLR
jgi:hypothetical protein